MTDRERLRLAGLAPLAAHRQMAFQPLPAVPKHSRLHLGLDRVVGAPAVAAIQAAGRLVFHAIGDTGGVVAPQAQQIVAMHMTDDFQAADVPVRPSFLYHLGDVVYYNGETAGYYPQFYQPYLLYPAPIVGIPGNHDGDPLASGSEPSLAAFVHNFCAHQPVVRPEAHESTRTAMVQPFVYWALDTPFATLVGCYSNVPEGGQLADAQVAWLVATLRDAPKRKALILAIHHPLYSLDQYHGDSPALGQRLDAACAQAGRSPDLVLTGHVHNYQRFTRRVGGREIPYLVVGAGGYWHLHYMAAAVPQPTALPFPIPGSDATLEAYCDDRHGYLRLEVSAGEIAGVYRPVPRPQESWRQRLDPIDRFRLDLKRHALIQ